MKHFCDFEKIKTIFSIDENGRDINLYMFSGATVVGDKTFYPNTVFNYNGENFKPTNETIMSLSAIEDIDDKLTLVEPNKTISEPVFFFIYNTENYYHFIYDTLPYLISYFKLKETISELKLLMDYPNAFKKEQYRFVIEFLSLLGITEKDIIYIERVKYDNLYISTSYTHDNKSNTPPRSEVFGFLTNMVKNINCDFNGPNKIYVSRRTWIHNDFSNIGTNYTTRRKMVNEDELVDILKKHGFTEVFTENLTTVEKICLFKSAKVVVGAIGGGICNVLFSPPETKLIAISSPEFLSINERFLFSLNRVNLEICGDTKHVETGEFKHYMRVMVGDVVGEITEVGDGVLKINYVDEKVAGWNQSGLYKTKTAAFNECKKIDNGLNSPWEVELEKFKTLLT